MGSLLCAGKNSKMSQHRVSNQSEFISEVVTQSGLLHGQSGPCVAGFASFVEFHLIGGGK